MPKKETSKPLSKSTLYQKAAPLTSTLLPSCQKLSYSSARVSIFCPIWQKQKALHASKKKKNNLSDDIKQQQNKFCFSFFHSRVERWKKIKKKSEKNTETIEAIEQWKEMEKKHGLFVSR
jgi:hypothetical protein